MFISVNILIILMIKESGFPYQCKPAQSFAPIFQYLLETNVQYAQFESNLHPVLFQDKSLDLVI